MALVSGLGGGHGGATFFDKRNSIIAQQQEHIDDCGCMNLRPKKRKKSNKTALLKERIKQFSIWFFENEDHKEVEHVRRRLERKRKRKMLAKKRGARSLRWLYVLDVILWIVGIAFILCSTVKAFGLHTAFYKNKDLYLPLGSGILLLAILVLFLETALRHRMNVKHAKPQRGAFYIVKKNKNGSETDPDIKDPDNDSGNEEDIEMELFGLQREHYLETIEEIGVKGEETVRTDNGANLRENIASSEWPNVLFYQDDETDTKHQNRRAWAKTKWMRMESFDNDDVLDLTENANNGEYRNVKVESTEAHAEPPSRLAKASGNRRITRFKPLSGGCFTAQSSIKSQTSEMSFASTTSESAPLVRK